MPLLVDVRTPAPDASAGLISGYAAIVLEVADAERSGRFYRDVLGLTDDGQSADGPRLRIGDGSMVLVERSQPKVLPESGAHFALRLPSAALEATLSRLAEAKLEVHTYHEDRASERQENRYLVDPDGNRLQLVAGQSAGIDHAALETHDIEWSESFYTHVLGGVVETRVGWRMNDYANAQAWGEGRDACAPGTRRWDKLYSTTIGPDRQVARPNAHIFVTFAPGVAIGLYLATEHRQEPPPEQFAGTPRLCFRTSRLDQLAERLRDIQLRCLAPSPATGGPFERRGGALFVRDPAGNFLEFVSA